jgi:hypothetical protein
MRNRIGLAARVTGDGSGLFTTRLRAQQIEKQILSRRSLKWRAAKRTL